MQVKTAKIFHKQVLKLRDLLKILQTSQDKIKIFHKTLYLESFGCTAIPVSPSIVSKRVVATIIFSSKVNNRSNEYHRGRSQIANYSKSSYTKTFREVNYIYLIFI